VVQAVVTAGARLHSFADAAFALGLAGVPISAKQVQQLTQEVGTDLAKARDAAVEARWRRVLAPRVTAAPVVVAVEVDGGRVRTRAAGCGPGVHGAEGKEDKIACLVTLTDVAQDTDPCPVPPPSFVEPRRVQRLVQQMAGRSGDVPDGDGRPAVDEPAADAAATPAAEPWSPQCQERTCVASLATSRSFGPMVAAEAQSRNFFAATRRAFVADGQAYNWTIHRGYFPDFVPVVDLLHVACYLFAAAQAVEAEDDRWPQYVAWLRACWQGRVAAVIAELSAAQERLGRPPPGEAIDATDPRRVVADALTYLWNNASRMDYPRYRREGLPTTSSLVESLVGEINARVKGRSKFWNRPAGVEAILQVRAALLSDDDRLERYFADRPGNPYRRRAA
jgi:hypothetical protein